MHNHDGDEDVNVTIQPSKGTIALIVVTVVFSLCLCLICLFFLCPRRGRETVEITCFPKEDGKNMVPRRVFRVSRENSDIEPPPSGFNKSVTHLTECRSTVEEEPSLVDSQTYRRIDITDDEDGKMRIQSMLENLDEIPANLLRSMIMDDATSSSNFFSSDERGDESTVLFMFEGKQVVMKYPSCELVSISHSRREDTNCQTEEDGLFPVESYSPMNRDQKLKLEESDISRVVSKSILTYRSIQSKSRTFNSRSKSKPRTIINISESIYPVYSETLLPIVDMGDEMCTEEEEDTKTAPVRQVRSHEVSVGSLVLSNVGPTVPQKHGAFLNIPNTSPNTSKKHLRITRTNSKGGHSNKKTKPVSEDEESLSHQPRARVRGEQIDYSSIHEDSMKSLTKNVSKSQKRTMQIIHDTRTTETIEYLNYPGNSQIWPLEESAYDSIYLKSLSKV